jgi:hypothetical protein
MTVAVKSTQPMTRRKGCIEVARKVGVYRVWTRYQKVVDSEKEMSSLASAACMHNSIGSCTKNYMENLASRGLAAQRAPGFFQRTENAVPDEKRSLNSVLL